MLPDWSMSRCTDGVTWVVSTTMSGQLASYPGLPGPVSFWQRPSRSQTCPLPHWLPPIVHSAVQDVPAQWKPTSQSVSTVHVFEHDGDGVGPSHGPPPPPGVLASGLSLPPLVEPPPQAE